MKNYPVLRNYIPSANAEPTVYFIDFWSHVIPSSSIISDLVILRAAWQIGCDKFVPEGHPYYPSLPVVIFPGNVGPKNALNRGI